MSMKLYTFHLMRVIKSKRLDVCALTSTWPKAWMLSSLMIKLTVMYLLTDFGYRNSSRRIYTYSISLHIPVFVYNYKTCRQKTIQRGTWIRSTNTKKARIKLVVNIMYWLCRCNIYMNLFKKLPAIKRAEHTGLFPNIAKASNWTYLSEVQLILIVSLGCDSG
jgi:hypothetical protein